jgi:hypothetical protein
MPTDPHDEIAARFAAFKRAVEQGDTDAYRALCVEDAPAETQLFEQNSEKVREHGWKLRLRRIEQEGEVAEVGFEVLTKDGEVVDDAVVTFTEEADGWRIRSL